MRVAVVGGGLAGLGCAYHLLSLSAEGMRESPLHCVHVWDPCEPGEGGASAVAAGLLHPYSPKGSQLWKGAPGLEAALELIQEVETHAGIKVCERRGMLRLALDEGQALAQRAQTTTPGSFQRWVSREDAGAIAGAEVGGHGGLHVPEAVTVDTRSYLRSLWQLCRSMGGDDIDVSWVQAKVESVKNLRPQDAEEADYDAIIVAAGAHSTSIQGLAWIPLRPCRGQNLLLGNIEGLQLPLICGKYIVPAAADGGATVISGATFEYGSLDACLRPADPEYAEAELLEALRQLHPKLQDAPRLGCQIGVRALPPRTHLGYVPLAGEIREAKSGCPASNDADMDTGTGFEARELDMDVTGECEDRRGPRLWMLSGLGSRGLIHHALLGANVARAVLTHDASHIPEEARRWEDQQERERGKAVQLPSQLARKATVRPQMRNGLRGRDADARSYERAEGGYMRL